MSCWEIRFINRLEIEGYTLISEKTKRKKDKVKINNINCQHGSFLMSPDKFMRGQGCPKCLRSIGEERVAKYFFENNIFYQEQYTFSDLSYKRTLRFDFATFDKEDRVSLLVEFDGQQHFEPVKFFGGEESYAHLVERDRLKSEYCKDNNIKLLRIPYWDYDNIEKILDGKFEIEQIKLQK